MLLKSEFPLLTNNPDLIYLDSAATTQKPQAFIDALNKFYLQTNANVHRGLYPLSEQATVEYEHARETLAQFIGAKSDQVVFTAGTTDGMNKLSLALRKPTKQKVLISGEQHHSAILPWRSIDYNFDYIRIAENLELDYVDMAELLSKTHYDILVLTHVSNVTGAMLDFAKVNRILASLDYQPIVIVDAAQSLAHLPISVNELPIDFLVASAHKVYGPTGLGLLWGKDLAKLPPFHVGGGMIRSVGLNSVEWADNIEKFEAGTPPIAEAISWAAAVKWLSQIPDVYQQEQQLTTKAVELMRQVPGISLYIPPTQLNVISFNIEKLHPHDISQLLGDPQFGKDKLQIAIRAGHHCAQIMHQQILKVPATARVSLALYNELSDIEKLISKLNEIKEFLK